MKCLSLALAVSLATISLASAQTYRDSGGTIVPAVVPLACPAGGGTCTGPAVPAISSGTPTQSTISITSASTTVLAASTATTFLKLCVALTAATGVWVNWAGATAVQAAPSQYLAPGQCDFWVKSTGYLPTSQINAIASATVAVTLIYN